MWRFITVFCMMILSYGNFRRWWYDFMVDRIVLGGAAFKGGITRKGINGFCLKDNTFSKSFTTMAWLADLWLCVIACFSYNSRIALGWLVVVIEWPSDLHNMEILKIKIESSRWMQLIITFLRFYWLDNIVQNWNKEYFERFEKRYAFVTSILLSIHWYRYAGETIITLLCVKLGLD